MARSQPVMVRSRAWFRERLRLRGQHRMAGPAGVRPASGVRRGGKIVAEAGLVGLFGIDFIVDDRGEVWLIEVNPRWTASLELYERRRGRSFVGDHLAATGVYDRRDREQGAAAWGSVSAACLGKWTVYAEERCLAADVRDDRELACDMDRGELADIPFSGTLFHRGDPVCTVLAEEQTRKPACVNSNAVPSASAIGFCGCVRLPPPVELADVSRADDPRARQPPSCSPRP